MSTDVSEVRAASIIITLMMEAAHTSERSVDIDFTTRQYIPEYSELHTHCCENLKSHNVKVVCSKLVAYYCYETLVKFCEEIFH
jgi:hypothetical protein